MNRSPFRSCKEREKKPFLSSALRNSLPAMSPLRGLLALSQRKFSRKTPRTRVAVNHFAGDLKFIEQVVHTDGQGHSHRRFRGRLCSSLTACRTTKVVLRALRTYRYVHVDGQDNIHQRLRGRLCISLTACTHRSIRITTSFYSSEARNFSPCYKRQIACYKCKVFFKIHFTFNI